jgi:hypothetical protein
LSDKLCVIIKDDSNDASKLFKNYIEDNFYGSIKNKCIKVLLPEWVKKINNMRMCYKKTRKILTNILMYRVNKY